MGKEGYLDSQDCPLLALVMRGTDPLNRSLILDDSPTAIHCLRKRWRSTESSTSVQLPISEYVTVVKIYLNFIRVELIWRGPNNPGYVQEG